MRKGSAFGPHLVSILLITTMLIVPSMSTGVLQEPTPMFRSALDRTGEVPGGFPLNNTTLWIYATEDPVQSSPVVHNGMVFVGTMGGDILCLDAFAGQLVWSFETGGPVESSPAVWDGKVYVGSDDMYVYCLNATDGSLVWRSATEGEIKSSPVVRDGLVYVGSNDFSVHCLDAADGDEVWTFETGGYVYSSPALWADTLYFGSCDGNMYAINSTSGEKVWNYTADFCPASPAVIRDLVIFGAYDGLLHYLDRGTGHQVLATTAFISEIYSSAGLFTNHQGEFDLPMVFVATTSGRMVGIGPNGEEFWNRTHGSGITSSPIVVSTFMEPFDPFIVYGDEGGTLHGIGIENPFSERDMQFDPPVEWHIKLGSSIKSSPFLWHNKSYVGVEKADGGGRVVCIGTINPATEPYVELIQGGYQPEGEVWVAMYVHNVWHDDTRVMVEFEGEQKQAYFHPYGLDPKSGTLEYLAKFNSTPPEGMKTVIVRVYEEGELVVTYRGQVMSVVRGWDHVDVRISDPKDSEIITKKIRVASGTASSNYTILGVYARWDDSDVRFNCTGTEDWTVALETAGLEEGWHTLAIVAYDDWRVGYSEIRVHIGEKDDVPSVTGYDIVAFLVLVVILVVLFRTKPPRVSEKAPTA